MTFSSHFQFLTHAYLIEGDRSIAEIELIEVLNAIGIQAQGNPDFWQRQYATFTIEDAREVKEAASKKKLGEGKRVFIISMESMTREASNALLKTLEEPGEDTYFFLITSSIRRVLPTILSRARVVKHASQASEFFAAPEEFLASSPAERMKAIKEIFVKLEKEEIAKADINGFIEALLRKLHESKKGKSLEKEAAIASYGRDQSASLKMVLEYLALAA
jgi:DNA polymerase III delta prime subunit